MCGVPINQPAAADNTARREEENCDPLTWNNAAMKRCDAVFDSTPHLDDPVPRIGFVPIEQQQRKKRSKLIEPVKDADSEAEKSTSSSSMQSSRNVTTHPLIVTED